MEYVSYALLREIVHRREVSIAHVGRITPRRFGDHRDFYGLATLCSAGYVDCTIDIDCEGAGNQAIAAMFHTLCLGPGKQKYMMYTFFNSDETNEEKVYATAKADLYFAELRQKRIDRAVTLVSSIVVGVMSALLTLVAKSALGV